MRMFVVGLVVVCTAALAFGGYSVDADTLHLYHFDGDATDAAGSMDLALNNGATFTGNALDVYDRFEAEQTQPYAAAIDNPITIGDVVGADGAFTFEAMIYPLIGLGQQNHHMEIISCEDGDGPIDRGFQFRITGASQLEFAKLSAVSGSHEVFSFPVPQSGPNVHWANHWYHVAVTYNGLENTADNLKFYWTKADAGFTEAQLLASFTMVTDMDASDNTNFCVGNELRGTPDENYEGLIDEVRISSIARSADAMNVPEPATLLLLGLGSLVTLKRRSA